MISFWITLILETLWKTKSICSIFLFFLFLFSTFPYFFFAVSKQIVTEIAQKENPNLGTGPDRAKHTRSPPRTNFRRRRFEGACTEGTGGEARRRRKCPKPDQITRRTRSPDMVHASWTLERPDIWLQIQAHRVRERNGPKKEKETQSLFGSLESVGKEKGRVGRERGVFTRVVNEAAMEGENLCAGDWGV